MPAGSSTTGGQILHDEAFPASPSHWMAQHSLAVIEAEQSMDDAAVTHVDLRRFDEALANIGVEWWQATKVAILSLLGRTGSS